MGVAVIQLNFIYKNRQWVRFGPLSLFVYIIQVHHLYILYINIQVSVEKSADQAYLSQSAQLRTSISGVPNVHVLSLRHRDTYQPT